MGYFKGVLKFLQNKARKMPDTSASFEIKFDIMMKRYRNVAIMCNTIANIEHSGKCL